MTLLRVFTDESRSGHLDEHRLGRVGDGFYAYGDGVNDHSRKAAGDRAVGLRQPAGWVFRMKRQLESGRRNSAPHGH